MAAKRVCGRHSSLVWNGVGMKRMGVLMGMLRRARMCLQRWGGRLCVTGVIVENAVEEVRDLGMGDGDTDS